MIAPRVIAHSIASAISRSGRRISALANASWRRPTCPPRSASGSSTNSRASRRSSGNKWSRSGGSSRRPGSRAGASTGRQGGEPQSAGARGASSPPGSSAPSGAAMHEAAQEMRGSTSDLQRQDPSSAAARGARAADQLREMEQRLRSGSAAGREPPMATCASRRSSSSTASGASRPRPIDCRRPARVTPRPRMPAAVWRSRRSNWPIAWTRSNGRPARLAAPARLRLPGQATMLVPRRMRRPICESSASRSECAPRPRRCGRGAVAVASRRPRKRNWRGPSTRRCPASASGRALTRGGSRSSSMRRAPCAIASTSSPSRSVEPRPPSARRRMGDAGPGRGWCAAGGWAGFHLSVAAAAARAICARAGARSRQPRSAGTGWPAPER